MSKGQKPGAVKFQRVTRKNGKEHKRWVQVGIAWPHEATVSLEIWFKVLPSDELVIFWNEDGEA